MLKKFLLIFLLIITVCIFCFFLYKIGNYLIEEKENKDIIDNLQNVVVIKNEETNSNIDENKENTVPLIINFEELKKENKDIIAWIYLEGSQINYPIVQAQNNEFYLRRLINGEYNRAGTIFLDYRNNPEFKDFNSIIYGHNMKNGTMFGELLNYTNQEYYEKNKEMYLFTENKNYLIEVFAGAYLTDSSKIYELPTKENIELIKDIKKNSTFYNNIETNENDKFIILSTCAYDYDDERYVIIGILKEVE